MESNFREKIVDVLCKRNVCRWGTNREHLIKLNAFFATAIENVNIFLHRVE